MRHTPHAPSGLSARRLPSGVWTVIRLMATAALCALIALAPGSLQAQYAPQLIQGEISDPNDLALSAGREVDHRPLHGQDRPAEVDVAWLWASGLVGGAAGLGLGVLVGLEAHPSLESPFYGGLAGYTIGVPIGVHLANRRRGQPWITGLASALPMATLLVFGRNSGDGALIPVAGLQLVGSAAAERYGERRRAEAQNYE